MTKRIDSLWSMLRFCFNESENHKIEIYDQRISFVVRKFFLSQDYDTIKKESPELRQTGFNFIYGSEFFLLSFAVAAPGPGSFFFG